MLNESSVDAISDVVSRHHVRVAVTSLNSARRDVNAVLRHHRLPVGSGYSDQIVETLLYDIALLDGNNHVNGVGAGEREGRVYSSVVRRRHYGLSHGIGRSGVLTDSQPKAVGSTLINRLATRLVAEAMRLAGVAETISRNVLLLPVATGAAITLTLSALIRQRRLADVSARRRDWFVVVPRIDQQTCLKCIVAANATAHVVPLIVDGDELTSDIDGIRAAVQHIRAQTVVDGRDVLAIMSVSSCFAPRAPDRLVEISVLCAQLNVAHVVNNAYGLHSAQTCKLISTADRRGRVDAVIQSTDKNFLVPVGGAIIVSSKAQMITDCAALYPGRAAATTAVDMFATLLQLGTDGWTILREQRERVFLHLKSSLSALSVRLGERVLETPNNAISMAMTLDRLQELSTAKLSVEYLGAMLYARSVSGIRCFGRIHTQRRVVADVALSGFGRHCDEYPHAYMTLAAAVGMTESDVDSVIQRIEAAIKEWKKQRNKLAKDTIETRIHIDQHGAADVQVTMLNVTSSSEYV